jgi:glycosyltransferase involved in cell wall biosynthesis
MMEQLHSNSKPKIVVAIPCFNTRPFIGDIVRIARNYADRVIVVDDGSHDGTPEIARAAGALVTSHDRNRGYGATIKSCFEEAKANTADILVIIDGDGQHDPDEIPRLIAPILQGEADLVIGSRFLNNEVRRPRYRKFGIRLITFLVNLGSRTKVSDSQSGFRSYDQRLIRAFSLTETGMSSSLETLEKSRRLGAVIKEVPISCHYSSSTPNFNAFWHGLTVAAAGVTFRLQSLFGGSHT